MATFFEDFLQQAEIESMYSSVSTASPGQASNEFASLEQQLPFDYLNVQQDLTAFDPDNLFSYFMLPEIHQVFPESCLNQLAFDGSFPHQQIQVDAFEYPQVYHYETPSPSPSLVLESPFSSFHAASPPHTPAPAYLPMSSVAPTPTFLKDTSPPTDAVSHTTTIATPQLPVQRSVSPSSSLKPTSLLKTVKKSISLKKSSLAALPLKPLYLKDFKQSPTPNVSENSEASYDSDDSASVVTTLSPSKTEAQVPPSPVYSPRRNGSSKKPNVSAGPTKKRHILQ
ncbi:hypothetical protein BDR26DRAFT_419095, partial [Obelidium mucronatum]